MNATDILWGVAVFFSCVLAGGVVTVSVAVIPALHVFDPDTDFKVHKIFNPLPDYYMPQSLFVSAFAAIAILIVNDHLSDTSVVLLAIALALSVPVILISLLLNRRFNLVVRRWEGPGLPENYVHRRKVWDNAHITRTVGCVLIALCYILASGPTA